MITVFRDRTDFMVRVDLHDQASNLYNTNYITLTWRDANDLQSKLSQLLLDFEIERGAYPISDEDDYILDRHTTGEPF
tara:strand:+ start:1498 stop:1731 length:234 start_codon:yes stop_codon:yes gene_type:complete